MAIVWNPNELEVRVCFQHNVVAVVWLDDHMHNVLSVSDSLLKHNRLADH